MNLTRKLFVLLGLAAALTVTQAGLASDFDGSWAGALTYRGDDLDIKLHVRQSEQDPEALLDIPALVYARQAITAQPASDGAMLITLPFGIGDFSLVPKSESSLGAQRDRFSLHLDRVAAPGHQEIPIRFASHGRELEGTLFLPANERPGAVMVLVAGSNNANRQSWSYSSWVYTYLDMGVGAFIYDRRPDLEVLEGGQIPGIETHVDDVVSAIRAIQQQDDVDRNRIGLVGSSRGGWIAMAAARQLPELKMMVLSSVAIATPAEQEVDSILARMRNDGMTPDSIAAARDYLRLYFLAARSDSAWHLLEQKLAESSDEDWFQYVDQPRNLADLRWWRSNMDFDAIAAMTGFAKPLLAMWGANDVISPWTAYKGTLDLLMQDSENPHYVAKVFERADHRLEAGFYEDEQGAWHWLGMAPGVLDSLRTFVSLHFGLNTPELDQE